MGWAAQQHTAAALTAELQQQSGKEGNKPRDLLVAHHKHLQLFDIVDQKLPESSGQHMLCLLVAPITDVGHQDLALEPPANSVIDTSRFPPVALKKHRKHLVFSYKTTLV